MQGGIDTLLGLRWVMATLLVVHHSVHVHMRGTGASWSSAGVLHQGYLAVSLFLVLSGFGLATRWSERLEAGPSVRGTLKFLWMRWAAVAPVALMGTVLGIGVAWMRVDSGGDAVDAMSVAIHLGLVQSLAWMGDGPHGVTLLFDGPAWSVSTLLVLTAVFPLVVPLRRWVAARGGRLLAFASMPWMAVTLSAMVWHDAPLGRWFFHSHPLARGADFMIGVAIGWGVLQRRRGLVGGGAEGVAIIAVAGTLLFAMTEALPLEVRYTGLYAPVAALLLVTLYHSTGPLARALAGPVSQMAGRHAFAVLMLHVPLMHLLWELGAYDSSRWVGHAALVATTVACARVVHRWVEVPARRRLRGVAVRDNSDLSSQTTQPEQPPVARGSVINRGKALAMLRPRRSAI